MESKAAEHKSERKILAMHHCAKNKTYMKNVKE